MGMGRPSRPGLIGSPNGPSGPGGASHDAPTFNDRFGGYSSPSGGPGVNTRPYGSAAGTLPRSPATGRQSAPYGTPERPGPSKNNGPLIAVIVAATVLLLGLSCFLIVTITNAGGALKGLVGGAPTATHVPTVAFTTVPKFVGMDLTVAQARAQDAHLIIDTSADVTYKTDLTVKKGVIMQQAPDAQTQQPYGSHIQVTVSSGPEQTKVPNVINMTYSQALGALAANQLKANSPIYQQRSDVPPNTVFNVDPPVGTSLPAGTAVTLYVSTAPAVTPTATTAAATPTLPTCATGTPTPCH